LSRKTAAVTSKQRAAVERGGFSRRETLDT
jgi:hypothetical protein